MKLEALRLGSIARGLNPVGGHEGTPLGML